MIHLLNETHTKIGSFADYSAFIDHINKTELSRLNFLKALNHTLEVPHALEQTKWGFVVYKHALLKAMYSCTKEPPITGIEREAFQQQLDLIDIFRGTADNPLQIPVTEDIDIESLKQDFCLAYCRAHNYVLSETLGQKDKEEKGAEDKEGTRGGEDDQAV